jgi:type II secretory pathway component GspD/PulD (secretin)
VNYKDSGIIFKILPEVRFSVIDLNLSQELSNFTTTDNGVNESPTLIKRAISTDISLKDGDIILIGGLADNKNTDTKTGFSLFPFLTSKGSDSTKTDIVIVLQVENPVTRSPQRGRGGRVTGF